MTSTTVTYLPNDILLTWFNENYKPAYMTKYERNSESRMTLLFNAPTDSAPELRIVASDGPLAALNGKPSSEWAAIDMSAGRDSLDIWITDSAVIRTDSLLISARYLMTDTTDRLVWATDTVKMFMRNSGKKKKTATRTTSPRPTMKPPTRQLPPRLRFQRWQSLSTVERLSSSTAPCA